MARMPRAIRDLINGAMLADRPRLRSIAKKIAAGKPDRSDWQPITDDAQKSFDLRTRRADLIPVPDFPPQLPVSERIDEITELVRNNQVVVLCGETGSGKTTQLPKVFLRLGMGDAGLIGHTQPRRLAARSVASRLADELNVKLGREVGAKVRFTDQTGDDTLIKVMTDGVLLAEIQSDRRLRRYQALIIDEAHERSLNIDFLLGYLRQLLPKRPDLKLVVTSATIDPQRFAEHFKNERGEPAPIIEVSGRTYPVEIRYRPPALETDDRGNDRHDHAEHVCNALDELWRERRGDVLVFEPGEREIRDTAEAIATRFGSSVEVLPLYARLAHHQQDQIFKPSHGRRVVVSTNVAETSLTVPGIRYVIDGGTARINRYSPRTRVQRLEVEPISRASARQRAGRCGRIAEGVCVRLYDEADHDQRPEFTDPEIARANLAAVILRMKALGLGDVSSFPFVEAPDPKRVRAGQELLEQLGALDARGKLTQLGDRLSRLPLDPRLGRILLEADDRGCLADALIVVSAISVQDPRDRPFDQRDDADAAHAAWRREGSDFLSLVALWKWFDESAKKLGSSKLRRACEQRYISNRRMREWREVHRQLKLMLSAMGYHAEPTEHTEYEPLHRSLLAGMLDGVLKKAERGEYEGLRGQRVAAWPGSVVAGKRPKWLVAGELVRTSRLFARMCGTIETPWIEEAAGDLLKRTYSQPAWESEAGKVIAYERVTLNGLEIAAGRRVHYGPIDPAASRELFIRHALVHGDLRRRPPWLRANLALMDELEGLEDKLRAKGALLREDAAIAFYDEHVPAGVFNSAKFDRWAKKLKHDGDHHVRMTRDDLLPQDADLPDAGAFPDELETFGASLKLDYAHTPGAGADGVTLSAYLPDLPTLDPMRLEWLVPGLLEEKVRELIKLLPKDIRRRIDAPVLAKAAVAELEFGEGDLYDALSALIERRAGIAVRRGDWQPEALPGYLRVNVRILNDRGKVIDEDR
ncbi:MAG: ATP-dependent RNA helicase HrpA, partial [Planctomycetota bacterium]